MPLIITMKNISITLIMFSFDIYQSNNDGLIMIEKLLEQANLPTDKLDFWIENSCLEILPTLIFDYVLST